ncbi:hypothetical protein KC361_g9166 [Hortaea werneckii]|nr:hypothetical protein KC361_g9166 [Hortaea werneckii]
MDEKGFLIGKLQKTRRIFTRELYEQSTLTGAGQDGSREWITVVATICADGTKLSPALIYKAISGNLQDTWLNDFEPEEHDCHFSSSPNGWTSDELGYSWLTGLFEKETAPKARRSHRLLFVDGHGSHLNMKFLDWCEQHKTLLAVYPPHSTHRLQPLDVSVFAPMANYYSQALDDSVRKSEGRTTISKRDFFSIFWPAFEKAFTKKNIASAWSNTGIWPFDPPKVLDSFPVAQEAKTRAQRSTERSSDSPPSIYNSPSKTRRLRSILNVSSARSDKKTQKTLERLSDTVLGLSAKLVLSNLKVKHLSESLSDEKTRKKRKRKVTEELRASGPSGALFMSPSKIQKTRDIALSREREKEQLQQDKEVRAQERAREKAQKEVEARRKRDERSAAAVARKTAAAKKKAAAQMLQYSDGGIAPGTRYLQTLWVRRFESAGQAWGQDINKPYGSDDLIRFFAAIIPKMVSPGDKTVPQKSTILRGLGIVLAYSHFKWSDFMMGAHVSSRFKVFLEQAIRDGKLKTGHWQKQTWLGFAVLSRLVSSFLAHKIQHGTHNWDIQIAKCLSLVLVAALGARSGDVSRSHRYTGQQFLQYRHINLHLVGSQPILANLRATITLEFCKNHKLADNEETQYYFSPLGKVEHNHMCPIAWLLVHALRHSLVADASLQDVLNRAFARTDRQVEWLYPSRPVLASIDQRSEAMIHIDLDKPAGAQQLLRSTKEMGVLAGMLDRAYTHAIRLGHARDIAQLPTNAPVGYNTDHVRQSLGHTAKSSYKGVTDNYIGGLHTEVYTLRAQHSSQPQGRIPRFVTPDGKLESRAMTAEKLKSGPTTTTPLPEISRHRHPLADKDVNIPATNASKAAAPYHPLQNVDPALLTEDKLADVAATVPTPAADELYSTVFPESALGSNAVADKDNIDSNKNNATAVLDVFSNADAQAALQSLADKSGAEEDEALFVTDENPAPIYSTAEIFITTYSKVN